jgi:hypothetical protein|uniref:Uncharacterized protein n=1 Tax=Myoviridae sp. ctgXL3 TaxID=2826681 RepID=A0A8S5QRP5_9CAUD|nr:MAG TPA: hypothetical protein [Myoviridae sp. ctgXL3]
MSKKDENVHVVPNCTITRMLSANGSKTPLPTLDSKGVCSGVMKGKTPYALCQQCRVFKK